MSEDRARPGPALLIEQLEIGFPGAGTVVEVPGFALPGGSIAAVEGPSGSGKTSLLHALAGLERPRRGVVRWGLGAEAVSVWSMADRARDGWRRRSVGLVFQDIHLVEGLSALENVLLPVLFERLRPSAAERERGAALLSEMGIAVPGRQVGVMSRGERQRVAIARALLPGPVLLLADEPTASLDRGSAGAVSALLIEAARAAGATLVVASHDPVLLEHVPTRLRLAAGRLEAA